MRPQTADITAAIQVRAKFQQRLRDQETPLQRLDRFVRLQQDSFELLRSSPAGLRHFLRRNLRSRRVEVIDGNWRPVSADRRAYEA